MKLSRDEKKSIKKELDGLGIKIVGEAKRNCPVDTGHLRSSITHEVTQDLNLIVGSPVHYAPYVEYGTPVMVQAHGEHDPENPVTSWEAKRKRGGMRNTMMPFLRPAVDKVMGNSERK